MFSISQVVIANRAYPYYILIILYNNIPINFLTKVKTFRQNQTIQETIQVNSKSYLQDILLTVIFRNICGGLTFIICWQQLAFYRTKLSYFCANTTTHVHLQQ